jgi:ADP-ribose pyrophosphatase YjhB (NUDIX family)
MALELLRLAAYGVCLRQDQILLARYVSPDGGQRHWALPGGKVEHGEDPCDAVVRELAEETGYDVAVQQLLGLDTRCHHVGWGSPSGAELHRVGIIYYVQITGGTLRSETSGSTDLARWIPVTQVPSLERTASIDTALELERTRPPSGHVTPVPVRGLLRH